MSDLTGLIAECFKAPHQMPKAPSPFTSDEEKAWDESEHPRDDHGRWTDAGGGGDEPGTGYEFVSPNVRTDMQFGEAVQAISSQQQEVLKGASRYIDSELKLSGHQIDAVGAWSDGAENSVMDAHTATKWTDWDKIALASVMKAHLADQKSVLPFQVLGDRKPRESIPLEGQYPHMLGTLPEMTVEVNPSGRELRQMAEENRIRVTADADGNLYAWDAVTFTTTRDSATCFQNIESDNLEPDNTGTTSRTAFCCFSTSCALRKCFSTSAST
jgi:hypothetical protein